MSVVWAVLRTAAALESIVQFLFCLHSLAVSDI